MIKKFSEIVGKCIIKIALAVPLNSFRFSFILVVITLWDILNCGRNISSILRYRKAIEKTQTRFILFKCFMSRNYDWLFQYLVAENPKKYLQYVCIEGEEYVRELMKKDTGVILISGHFGPFFRTLIFKEVFGIRVSAFASVSNKNIFFTSSEKRDKIISSFPIYTVGEERQMQEGLLRKEWVIFLNDVPVKKRGSSHYTLLGKNVYMSELPFKISISHNIPILFVGVTKIKRHYHVSIIPIKDFNTQQDGLKVYIALIEKLLCHDPYAGNFIAETHF